MRETGRDKQLLPACRAESSCGKLPEGGRARADIDGDVEHRTGQHADQFRLRIGRRLEMQTANGARRYRQRFIILHKLDLDPGRGQQVAPIGLAKIAARIGKPFRLY